MRKPSIFLVTLLFAAALLPSCNKQAGAEPSEGEVQEIVITSPKDGKLELTQGETAKIKYTVLPESAASTAVIEWTSSDSTVVTVKNGKVSSWSEGEATVTATCGKASAEVEVTVNPVSVVSFSLPESVAVYIGYPCEVEDVSVELDPDIDVDDLEATAAALNWDVTEGDESGLNIEINEGKAIFTGLIEGEYAVTVSAKHPKEGSKAETSQTITVYVSDITYRAQFYTRGLKGDEWIPADNTRTEIIWNNLAIKKIFMNCWIPDFQTEDLSISSSNESVGTLVIQKQERPNIELGLDFKGTFGSTDISIIVKDREYNFEHKRNFTLKIDPKGIAGDMVVTAPDGTTIKDGGSYRLAPDSTGVFSINSGYEAKWQITSGAAYATLVHSEGSEYWAPKAKITATSLKGSATVKVTDQAGKSMTFTLNVAKQTFPSDIYIIDDETGEKVELYQEGTSILYAKIEKGKHTYRLSDPNSKGYWTLDHPSSYHEFLSIPKDHYGNSVTVTNNAGTVPIPGADGNYWPYQYPSGTTIQRLYVCDEAGENSLCLALEPQPIKKN